MALLGLVAAAVTWLPAVSAEAAAHHRVRPGETMSLLHHRFHRSVRCLARRNRIHNVDLLRVGRVLAVPSHTWCHHHHKPGHHAHHGHHHHGHHAHHRRHHHGVGRSAALSRSGSRTAIQGAQTVSAYKAWARAQVGAAQFAALDAIWTRESGWNQYAKNPSSGAYGIPQALPGSKMATAGSDWSWDGYTQMRWGIHYIYARYGSPANAWAFWQAHHWY